MKKICTSWLSHAFTLMLMVAVTLSAAAQEAGRTGASGAVPLLKLSGPIGPASVDYVARGLQNAEAAQVPLVVLQIDTPGGLDSSTREIIKAILASPVPVLAWVAPSGARAASAGAYIVYASHIAAMAPGTNLGAATPVQIGALPGVPRAPAPTNPVPSGSPGDESSKPAEEAGMVRSGADAMTRKIVNDSAAYLRSLAQMRGRNVEWADHAVRDGASLSALEAQTRQVIDYIAADQQALLAQAQGRSVLMGDGHQRAINTGAAGLRVQEPDWRTRVLGWITDPTVAYLLLLLGIYGIYFELTSPGIGLPGVVGSISLLLGMFALQMLPVSFAGAALIVLGFAMLVAEALLPSFGALGIGGVIAFVVGSVMLIDTEAPGFGIPMGVIASAASVNVLFIVVVLRLALKARDRPIVSGSEELPGAIGEVLESSAEASWVRVHGERWQAASGRPLHTGQRVRVVARVGLVLQVEPEPGTAAATPAIGGQSG